jgi:hypothetical protein
MVGEVNTTTGEATPGWEWWPPQTVPPTYYWIPTTPTDVPAEILKQRDRYRDALLEIERRLAAGDPDTLDDVTSMVWKALHGS